MNCDRGTTLAGDVDYGGGDECVGPGSICKVSVLSLQFCSEPKTALKRIVFTKKKEKKILLSSISLSQSDSLMWDPDTISLTPRDACINNSWTTSRLGRTPFRSTPASVPNPWHRTIHEQPPGRPAGLSKKMPTCESDSQPNDTSADKPEHFLVRKCVFIYFCVFLP